MISLKHIKEHTQIEILDKLNSSQYIKFEIDGLEYYFKIIENLNKTRYRLIGFNLISKLIYNPILYVNDNNLTLMYDDSNTMYCKQNILYVFNYENIEFIDKENNPPITNEIKSFISELKVDDYYSDSEMNDLEIIFRIKEINHYNMVVESLIIYKYKKLPNLKYNEHHVIQFNDLFNNGNNLIKIEKNLFNTKINSLKYLNQKYDNEIKNKQEIEFEVFETIKEVSDYMRLNPNILAKNVINSFKTYIREEYKREEIIFKNNLKLIQIGTVLTRFGDLYKVGDMDYDACYLIGITSTENQTRIFEISESKDDVIKFYSIVKNIDFDSLKQEILDFKLI